VRRDDEEVVYNDFEWLPEGIRAQVKATARTLSTLPAWIITIKGTLALPPPQRGPGPGDQRIRMPGTNHLILLAAGAIAKRLAGTARYHDTPVPGPKGGKQ